MSTSSQSTFQGYPTLPYRRPLYSEDKEVIRHGTRNTYFTWSKDVKKKEVVAKDPEVTARKRAKASKEKFKDCN
jgi:hypothetical protein